MTATAASTPPSTTDSDEPERALLVDLLHEAAKLEHCLLDAYLYTAASLKSTPQEFATVTDAAGGQQDNRRRAVQFERARLWKQMILEVTHEEMLHLHYVQTLLRSLGERPSFALPDRDPATDNWVMSDWQALVGAKPVGDGTGVEIPVDGATIDNLRRFVLYEATDALQDMDPYGTDARALFRRLAEFELDLRFEMMLAKVDDGPERTRLRTQLEYLYTDLTPLPTEPVEPAALREFAEPEVERFSFQSIADFYNEQVLPRFKDAFDNGWVRQQDRDLVNELQGADAAEGFLPMQAVYRDKNFDQAAQGHMSQPLIGVRSVEDIIKEIIEEGEGATDFVASAKTLLTAVKGPDGARRYLAAILDDKAGKDTPAWFNDGQLVRTSHLYRFAIVLTGMEQEAMLAKQAGTTFSPVRTTIDVKANGDLAPMTEAVTTQFNACYLVLAAWLSRMYEIKDWQADQPRRLAIEMLASWPLMSMGIRPLLELSSFLPIDRARLFRLADDGLPPSGSTHELLQLWEGDDRSEDVNSRMDRLALQTLTEIADWAAGQSAAVAGCDGLDDNTRAMVTARLQELDHLREFEKEFPYRNAGGYSDREPDLTYTQLHPGGQAYSEAPTMQGAGADPDSPPPLFDQTLLLRLRFAGWGIVQLATDPDPTFDEVGVSGTHMLHAADGDRRLDRALVWNVDDEPGSTILRGPDDAVPPVGVDLVDVSLCVAPGEAPAGYAPLGVVNSTGAVQTSGLQQDVEVDGLAHVIALPTEQFSGTVHLLARDGVAPSLNGLNHVVSQDGEAIDPFVLSVRAAGGGEASTAFEREVFNGGTAFFDMTPLQRLETARRPNAIIPGGPPSWAAKALPEQVSSIAPGTKAFAEAWLSTRATALGAALAGQLDSVAGEGVSPADVDWTRDAVDEAVSLAERLVLTNVPKGTTAGWLRIVAPYGHTVSGDINEKAGGALLAAMADASGMPVSVTEQDRNTSNGRWLARYTLGVMDTDSLRDLVFGEVLIPLTTEGVDGVTLTRAWELRADMATTVAALACRFDDPFWGTYETDGTERTTTLPDKTTITDRLRSQHDDGYSWTTTGVAGLTRFDASLALDGDRAGSTRTLTLEVEMSTDLGAATVAGVGIFATIADAIPASFADHAGLTPID